MPTLLITGANRGLGLEFVRQYAHDNWDVIACCREPNDAEALNDIAAQSKNVSVRGLDVSDFSQIDALADELIGTAIDVLINNAGIFGPKAHAENDWRQSFGHMDYDVWQDVLTTNLMSPLKMAEAFVAHVASSDERKIVTISSTVGSIADTETGIYAYRTSKAAVNMAMATLANELRPQGIAVSVFCPGWVKTRMGGRDALVEPEDSIAGLRSRIEAMDSEGPVRFQRYNGESIPW